VRAVASRRMGDEAQHPVGYGPLPLVRSESDILKLALEAAARKGDPDPELIQHTTGTRETATKTTGSWVRSDEPSYLIALRGAFTAPRPHPPGHRVVSLDHSGDLMSFPVMVLVVDVETGRVTDSGSSHQYPDLASVGPVITDHRGSR
jgi:hypothetical protein